MSDPEPCLVAGLDQFGDDVGCRKISQAQDHKALARLRHGEGDVLLHEAGKT